MKRTRPGKVSTLVDQAVEAYALLMDAKEQTRESIPILIDRAVMAAFGFQVISDIDNPTLSEDFITNFEGPSQDGIPFEDIESDISLADEEPVRETLPEPAQETPTDEPDPQRDDLIPDCTGKIITVEERDKYLLLVERILPGKKNIQARVDLLNEKAVPVSIKPGKHSGIWDKKKLSNNLRLAKIRLGDQGKTDREGT